jgi:hypothetical protein
MRFVGKVLGAQVVLAVTLIGVLAVPAVGGAASTPPQGPDTTELYADVLRDAVSRDAQFVYDLGWQATAVQETGIAVVAVQNEARAAYLRAVEEQEREEALAAFFRAAASREGPGGVRTGGDVEAFLECTRRIESTGNYNAVSPGGTYRGAYQFDQRTWDSNAAASGRYDLVGIDPASASTADQDQMARDLYARRGNQPWGGRC